MGMYDREPNFEDSFKEGDRFVLTGAEYAGTIQTREGPAEKAVFVIVSREHPDVKRRYSALGVGFANQAKRAEPSDFPHVAQYVRVPTGQGDNKVKLLAKVDVNPRDFINGEDGPPLDESADPAGSENLGF